jgi:hypothetical protein
MVTHRIAPDVRQLPSHHPRVSRETQRLLFTAVLAVLVLWLLARVRFTGTPATQNAVQPLLAQVTTPVAFAQLATDLARVQARLPELVVLADAVAALPVGDGLAAGLRRALDAGTLDNTEPVAVDPATGLFLTRVTARDPAAAPLPWLPRPAEPRYLFATVASSAGVTLTPVLVPALESAASAAWPGPIWRAPPDVALDPGAFVFTTTGALAGLVVDDRGRRAIVGPEVLHSAIEQLRSRGTAAAGFVGIEVQALTPALAAATGATGGVVVAWVDPRSPGAGDLAPGDVIEQANDERMAMEQWMVRAARVLAGESMILRVRRRGVMRDVILQAVPLPGPSDRPAGLGLTMRRRPDAGADVLAVASGTAAQRAGLRPGDLITHAGDHAAPTPGQVRAAFDAATEQAGVVLAVTRGTAHHVVVLTR